MADTVSVPPATAKVADIGGRKRTDITGPEPNAEVIKTAERLLSEARSGHLKGITGVLVNHDEGVARVMVGEGSFYGTLGALEAIKFELLHIDHHRDDGGHG